MTHAGPKTGRYLPPWIWVLGCVVAAVLVFGAAGGAISAMLPRASTATTAESRVSKTPAARTSAPSASATVAPSLVAAPVVQSQGVSLGGASGLSAADIATIEAAISAHDTDALRPYLGTSVGVVMPANGQDATESADAALNDLASVFTSTAAWNFSADPTALAHYRQGSFGRYFPQKALVGTSADGPVIALIPSGQGIVAMLIVPDDTLLLSN